jgi:hypothetical protein
VSIGKPGADMRQLARYSAGASSGGTIAAKDGRLAAHQNWQICTPAVGPSGDPADDPGGAVPVRPPPVRSDEQGSLGALAGGQVDRPGSARGERMATTLPPLRVMPSVRCPRSRPRCSMSAPVASDTRSPLRGSREISACSAGGPSRQRPRA